ncbi:hypothetical protein DFH11DRAFT_129869 [Phellopilus nigrolimitatus]|nr:hypothetical protein DFH11DRAFT_129869 [Phellopilus nigrolimitatus]
MFSKTLLSTLSLLVFISSALGAPAASCQAVSSITEVSGASSSPAAAPSSSASAAGAGFSSSAVVTTSSIAVGTSAPGAGKEAQSSGATASVAATSESATASVATSSSAETRAAAPSSAATSAAASSSAATGAAPSSSAATRAAAPSSAATSAAASSSVATGAAASSSVAKGAASSAAGAASSTAVSHATTTETNAAAATSVAATGTTNDAQSATTLDPAVIATGFALDGQQTPAAGQVASLTSTNNYINFCLTANKPITNGQQITTGSCNPAPMGVIAGTANMPSSKFTNPANFATLQANTSFTITMAVSNLQAGNFVNAEANYYSAPQQVDAAGNIIGHSHVVIEALDSLNSTAVTDPTKFAFFKGINGAAVNGAISADVTDGLPAGFYRMASINAAANHQPVLVAVAQHGSLDDMVYFTVA